MATLVTDQAPTKMYRKLWTKLAPSTDIGQSNRTSKPGGRKSQSRYRSLNDQPNLDKIKKYINKRLNKKTQRRYVRNPVSSLRSLSARKQSGKYSGKLSGRRKRKPWYSDGYPALREANQDREKRQQTQNELTSLSSDKRYDRQRLELQRKKSIYYEDNSDIVPYYRSRSVNTNKARDGNYTPITNEQDVIYQTYTGRDTLSHRRRSNSLPPLRSNSGSLLSTHKNVSPFRRPRNSISTIPSESAYLAADKDMKQKHLRMRTNLVKLSQEHHRQKSFKLDRRQKTDYDGVSRNHEQLISRKQKYESAMMLPKRKTLVNIETEYGKPCIVKSTMGPIYKTNKISRLKLDPIKHSVAQERTSKKRMIDDYIIQHSNSVMGDSHFPSNAMDESEFETITGTDFSTMETLSTAVIIPAQRTPDFEQTIAKQQTSEIRKTNGREKHGHIPNRLQDRSKTVQNHDGMSNHTLPATSDSTKIKDSRPNSNTTGYKDTKVAIKSNEYKNKPGVKQAIGTIKSPTVQKNNIDRDSVLSNGENKAITGKRTTSVTFKNNIEKQQPISETPSSIRILDGIDIQNKSTYETSKPTSNQTQINNNENQQLIRETPRSRLHEGFGIQNKSTHKTTKHTVDHQHEIDASRTSHNTSKTSRSDSSSKQTFYKPKETTNSNREQNTENKTNLDTKIHRSQNTNTKESHHTAVGKKESKGYNRVNDRKDKLANNSSFSKNAKQNISENNVDAIISVDTSRNISVADNTIDYEKGLYGRKITSSSVDGAIHWKELVQKHVRQPNPGVVNDETRTITKHESETTTETTTGIRQWRDLVQKYLHNKNPTFGKSTDRYLLEADADDDDDDDIDIFERARRKYRLNVESDEDSDDDD